MLKSNKFNFAIVLLAMVMAVVLTSISNSTHATACQHTKTYTTVVTASSCEQGMVERVCCEDCHEILQNISHSAPGHRFSDFEEDFYDVVTGLTVEKRECVNCGISETRTYTCAHVFNNWEYAPQATPVSTGYRVHTCTLCGRVEEEHYVEKMQSHEVYFYDSGIRATYAIVTGTSITSSDLGESVTYTARCILETEDFSNPYIFGNSEYGFAELSGVSIGETVYLSVDGRVHTYEVTASEFATINQDGEIIGTATGVNFMESPDNESVLHVYMEHDNGYWIITANMISDGSDVNIVT